VHAAPVRRVVSDGTSIAHDVDARKPALDDNFEFATWGVAVAKGVLVAAGDGGLFTSVDAGATWNEVTSVPKEDFALHSSSLGFFKDRFYLIGNGGTWTSTDGLTWSGTLGGDMLPGGPTGSFAGHNHAMAYGNGIFVDVNDDARYRLFDGATWTEGKVGDYGGWLSSIAFGNGRFVVVGESCCGIPSPSLDGLRATSTDGKAWSNIVTNETPGAQPIAFGKLLFDGTKFVSAGHDTWTSPDGVAWTQAMSNAQINDAALFEGRFVGLSDGGFATSSDGITWAQGPRDTNELGLQVLAVGRVLK
jgi:hypothetical protein